MGCVWRVGPPNVPRGHRTHKVRSSRVRYPRSARAATSRSALIHNCGVEGPSVSCCIDWLFSDQPDSFVRSPMHLPAHTQAFCCCKRFRFSFLTQTCHCRSRVRWAPCGIFFPFPALLQRRACPQLQMFLPCKTQTKVSNPRRNSSSSSMRWRTMRRRISMQRVRIHLQTVGTHTVSLFRLQQMH